LAAVRSRKIDVIVVYKVDRLTRSLADFAKLVELFDQHGVSFVSVTSSSIPRPRWGCGPFNGCSQ
jgi:site-specific DNA recombinase